MALIFFNLTALPFMKYLSSILIEDIIFELTFSPIAIKLNPNEFQKYNFSFHGNANIRVPTGPGHKRR